MQRKISSQSVKLIECPRDAWQGLQRQIPTELKVQYLRGLIEAGFRHLDAVSFVSPKAVPQMADSEEVLAQLSPPGDIELIGIVVNEKGAQRATATGAVTTLGYPCSISETFLRRNQKQSLSENYAVLQTIREHAREADLDVVVYISMAFGNPYGDRWNEEELVRQSQKLAQEGVTTISLADTIGTAEPDLVSQLLSAVIEKCSGCEVGVHLHSTRERAAAKVLAAYDAGCRRFDAALGGLGGCPFAQDQLVGNIPTEEAIRALHTRGIELPMASRIETVLGLNSRIAQEFAA